MASKFITGDIYVGTSEPSSTALLWIVSDSFPHSVPSESILNSETFFIDCRQQLLLKSCDACSQTCKIYEIDPQTIIKAYNTETSSWEEVKYFSEEDALAGTWVFNDTINGYSKYFRMMNENHDSYVIGYFENDELSELVLYDLEVVSDTEKADGYGHTVGVGPLDENYYLYIKETDQSYIDANITLGEGWYYSEEVALENVTKKYNIVGIRFTSGIENLEVYDNEDVDSRDDFLTWLQANATKQS